MKLLCTERERYLNFLSVFIITLKGDFVKKNASETGRGELLSARPGDVYPNLLSLKGLAVGALVLAGVCLMGTNQDAVQRAVVLVLAMVSTLLNGAFDAFIGMTVHNGFLL